MPNRLFAAGLLLLALIAACSPSAASTASVSTPEAAAQTETALEAVAQSTPDQPAWLNTPLIDAATGQTFTLLSFPGKTVYVELMATWCSNCRIQQGNVRTVRAQLSADDYEFISLSVEPKDTTAGLATYRQQYGYPWTFAVVPKDMMVALIAQFGQTVTNPTATPHFIISPGGALSPLSTGIHSTERTRSRRLSFRVCPSTAPSSRCKRRRRLEVLLT